MLQVGTKAASASASGDYMPLTALDAEAVCHLLTTMGKQIGKYHAAFADCEINGFQLNELKEKSQLEELSIKMPDLVFQDLMHRINDVKIIYIVSILVVLLTYIFLLLDASSRSRGCHARYCSRYSRILVFR